MTRHRKTQVHNIHRVRMQTVQQITEHGCLGPGCWLCCREGRSHLCPWQWWWCRHYCSRWCRCRRRKNCRHLLWACWLGEYTREHQHRRITRYCRCLHGSSGGVVTVPTLSTARRWRRQEPTPCVQPQLAQKLRTERQFRQQWGHHVGLRLGNGASLQHPHIHIAC